MKTKLIALAILIALAGCKKDSSRNLQSINVDITSISSTTTYNLSITNVTKSSTPIAMQNDNTDEHTILKAYSGDEIKVTYYFATQGLSYGQGSVDFTLKNQNLLHINGGYGSQSFIVP